MKKFIFIDLDDTVYDFKASERAALSATLERCGLPVTEEALSKYHEINDACWKRLEEGGLTRDEVMVGRFAELLRWMGADAGMDVRASGIYEEELSGKAIFLEGAKEALDELRGSGKYFLILASNGTRSVQAKRIAAGGIGGYFGMQLISEEIGAYKPAREFFDYAAERIEGYSAAEAVMAGDSLRSDILGAKNAGIDTVWIHEEAPAGEIIPDYRIDSLAQLPGLLELM